MDKPIPEAVDLLALEGAADYLAGRYSERDGWVQSIRAAIRTLTAAQQQGQESGGEVIQRHVVTKYRDGSVHVADVAAAECPHDWGQDEAHEDWARCYKCGISRRKPLAQQPTAVDESFVERFCGRWFQLTGRSLDRPSVRACLTEALAAQHQEPTTPGKKHDGPCWRNSHADCGC